MATVTAGGDGEETSRHEEGLDRVIRMFEDKEFEMSVQACAEYVGCSGDGGSGDGKSPRVPVGGEELPEFLRNALGYAAQGERMHIVERTMRGKRAAARMGRMPVGVGGAGIFGYDYNAPQRGRTVS